MVEPLTSLLIRELRISARKFGQIARSMDEMARALRLHLQPDVEKAMMPSTRERLDQETDETPVESLVQPSLVFGSGSLEDYD